MKSQIFETLSTFKTHLLHTPLLLGWLVIGLVIALVQDGWMGLAFGLVNLVLAGVYALIIRLQTPNPPAPEPVKRPTLELTLALVLFGLFLLTQLLDFGVWNIQPLQGWVREFFKGIGTWAFNLEVLPEWAKQDVFVALSSTLKQLIPTLLFFLLLGYGYRAMGLAHPHWKLTAVLVGITMVFGLFTGVLTRAPLAQVVALTCIGILINALPEELFFRGLLLPRLEKVFANPLNALVVSALFFNALHLPIAISGGESLPMALLDIFNTGYPSGLIWGYLYLRTRSILPGMFWHAANTNLGYMLFSL
jgi:membrane protease YdiL (CAAX protease family)